MTPRPRSFDEGVVLDRAMDLFWALGFEATSMQNLVDHMGIGRQSLYNTFGDKHRLFLAALGRYQAQQHDGPMAVLAAPGADLAAVRAFLLGAAECLGAQEPRKACFLMNAVQELSPRDTDVVALGIGHRRTLVQHLEAALTRSADRLRPGLTPAAAAKLLAHTTMGLGLTWKCGVQPEELVELVETALHAVVEPRASALAG